MEEGRTVRSRIRVAALVPYIAGERGGGGQDGPLEGVASYVGGWGEIISPRLPISYPSRLSESKGALSESPPPSWQDSPFEGKRMRREGGGVR